MKKLKIALLFLCLLITANITLAQSNPTVEIVLSQPTAAEGDVVTADVYVRNGTNIGGADIGITVDDKCLKIVDRQQGSFLPSSTEGSSFSPFSELHDHDTRLAVAITDRTKYANGDGVFFETHLQVTCAQGTAPLTVSFAEFSSYKDPSAANIELVAYTLTANTVTVINTQLTIVPASSVTVVPAQTLEASATPVQTSTPAVVPVAPVTENTSQDQTLLIVALSIMVLAVIGFIILIVVERRRRKR